MLKINCTLSQNGRETGTRNEVAVPGKNKHFTLFMSVVHVVSVGCKVRTILGATLFFSFQIQPAQPQTSTNGLKQATAAILNR